jgi:beta-glucosidase
MNFASSYDFEFSLSPPPRFSRRNDEGGSEDPRLSGAYGAAWSRGLQRGPGGRLQAVATLKHYDAQTVEDSDGWTRHTVSANVSRYMLADAYLPAFEISIKGGALDTGGQPATGAKGVMCACKL